MTLSFRSRLTLRWVSGFGLVLALALSVVYVGIRAFLVQDLDAQLRTLAGTELASSVDEPDQGVHLHEFPRDANNDQIYADKFVQLIDRDGRVLMQSPVLDRAPALIVGDTLRAALQGQAPIVTVSANGRAGRMTALATAGPVRYAVAVGLFTDKLDDTLFQLSLLLGAVWLGSLGLTALLGFTLASRALEPVRAITRQAATIAQGQFGRRLDEPTIDDEIGEMTRLLNHMLDRMHGAMEANRQFASDASHELRGPLTSMLGEIDVTLKRERQSGEYRDALLLLRERLTEMNQIADDLMLLVRAQERKSVPLVEVPLDAVLNTVAARHASTARAAGIAIRVDAPPSLRAYAEPRLLDRVFDNLVQNAIRHSPDGGTVTLSGRHAPADSSREWTADQAVITVRDVGPGIPREERERVFDRFYRLDRSRSRQTGGSGLGLAIAREIVQLFNGSIQVVDTDGPGTTIETRLPGGAHA